MELERIKSDEGWRKLFEFLKSHPFCEMKIEFRDGKPFMAEKVVENLKFN